MLKRLLLIGAILTSIGCTQVKSVNFTDVVGNQCQSTHVNPVWYSAETLTTCKVNDKSVPINTSHTDLSLTAGVLAFLAAFAVLHIKAFYMSRQRCGWCDGPIRKWIALNDSSDNYCSWICNKMEEQAYDFIWESQAKYQATYQRMDRDIWSLPIIW